MTWNSSEKAQDGAGNRPYSKKSKDQQSVDEVIEQLKQERNLGESKREAGVAGAEQERLRKPGREPFGRSTSPGRIISWRILPRGGSRRICPDPERWRVGEVLRVDRGKAEIAVGGLDDRRHPGGSTRPGTAVHSNDEKCIRQGCDR